MSGGVLRAVVRTVVVAVGLLLAGVSGVPARADPTPTPTPTPTPVATTPAPAPSPTPTLLCRYGAFAFPTDENLADVRGAGQSAILATTARNTTAAAYPDAFMTVQLFVAGATATQVVPAVQWSRDGGPWQPPVRFTYRPKVPGGGDADWVSGDLPLGTLAPLATYTFRFWLRFPAGTPQGGYNVWAYIGAQPCGIAMLGSSNTLYFGYFPTVYAHLGRGSGVKPGATASPTATPTTASPTPPAATAAVPAPALDPAARTTPAAASPLSPRTVVGLSVALLLAALSGRMAWRWWSARRRLP